MRNYLQADYQPDVMCAAQEEIWGIAEILSSLMTLLLKTCPGVPSLSLHVRRAGVENKQKASVVQLMVSYNN